VEKKMLSALNEHLNNETASAYLYFSMAADCHANNLPGSAHWLELQAQEELTHARCFYDYLLKRGQRILLTSIAQPQQSWPSLKEIFEATLAHEKTVTEQIGALVSLARECKDYATEQFLQAFVEEQVEEEASVTAVLVQVNRVHDSASLLFWLDHQLGQRQLTQK
jgi:ferritin